LAFIKSAGFSPNKAFWKN